MPSSPRRTDIEPLDHPGFTPGLGDTQPVAAGDTGLDKPQRSGTRLAPGSELARRARAAGVVLDPLDDPEMAEFLADDEGILGLQIEDPDWAFKWVRHMLRGEADGLDRTNIMQHQQGKLRWEFVRLEELPAEWRERLRLYQVERGQWEGFVVQKDLILARTPKARRDAYVRAQHYRAQQQRDSVRAGFADRARQVGSRLAGSEDRETVGD